jgi:hypothetical protein
MIPYKYLGRLLAERTQYEVSLQHQLVWDVETLMGEDFLVI